MYINQKWPNQQMHTGDFFGPAEFLKTVYKILRSHVQIVYLNYLIMRLFSKFRGAMSKFVILLLNRVWCCDRQRRSGDSFSRFRKADEPDHLLTKKGAFRPLSWLPSDGGGDSRCYLFSEIILFSTD